MNKRQRRSKRTKHGMSETPTWSSWNAMVTRCYVKMAKNYQAYGGRGIKVCDRWFKFEDFLKDMGERPPGTSLDRIDNHGNYEPGNCRWGTAAQQQNNRSDSRTLTINGETKTVSEWAHDANIPVASVFTRLRRGWTPERAIQAKDFRRREQ